MIKKLHSFWIYCFNRWLTFIPFHVPRLWLLGRMLGGIGCRPSVLMGVQVRTPGNIVLGDHVVINGDVLLDARGATITVGDNADIAPEAVICTVSHDIHDDFHAAIRGAVTVEDYAWIGYRAIIMPNVRIGRGGVVEAGSVVTENVPPMAIACGVPAKVIGRRRSALKYSKFYRPWFQ